MSGELPAEVLKSLQAEYIASFDTKARELLAAFKAQDLNQLKELFHKLAGSGKTYSFAELSEIARAAEDLVSKKTTPNEGVEKYLLLILDQFKKIRASRGNSQPR